MKKICFYCGSSRGLSPAYSEAAARCGTALAEQNIDIVYGGGNVGLMGVLADAALAAGGTVIGVIPRALKEKELAHRHLTKLITVETMHDRKRTMAEIADAFIALPGGVGTLEEVFEVFTWLQLGFINKPVGLLNVQGFYTPLMVFLEQVRAEHFLRPEHLEMLIVDDTIEGLLKRMLVFNRPDLGKWW